MSLRRGEGHRNVCIIPKSAHGTNPASAVMAGMTIVTVSSDKKGNVDQQELREKAEANKDKCAGPMSNGILLTSSDITCPALLEHALPYKLHHPLSRQRLLALLQTPPLTPHSQKPAMLAAS